MTEKLPAILQEIAELIGLKAALQIASHAGGTRKYIPAHAEDGHWLVECVGRENADKLCKHIEVDGRRGQHIDIPLCYGTYNQMIRGFAERTDKLDKEGASATEIARTLGVTSRTAHRHRARRRGKKGDDRQGKLSL